MLGQTQNRVAALCAATLFWVLCLNYKWLYSSPKSFVDFWVCGSTPQKGGVSTNHLGLL